jgi:hypothetical protein
MELEMQYRDIANIDQRRWKNVSHFYRVMKGLLSTTNSIGLFNDRLNDQNAGPRPCWRSK